jgi:hypothetical protein
MRAFLTIEQMTNQPDRWDARYEERRRLRQWFRTWAFTEPQRETSIGAPVMTDRQLEQFEWKLLNQDI